MLLINANSSNFSSLINFISLFSISGLYLYLRFLDFLNFFLKENLKFLLIFSLLSMLYSILQALRLKKIKESFFYFSLSCFNFVFLNTFFYNREVLAYLLVFVFLTYLSSIFLNNLNNIEDLLEKKTRGLLPFLGFIAIFSLNTSSLKYNVVVGFFNFLFWFFFSSYYFLKVRINILSFFLKRKLFAKIAYSVFFLILFFLSFYPRLF